MKDPGTNTRGMSRYFEQKGWKVKNALKDGSPETYEKFLDFVDSNLKQGIPLMVENVDWGGHWRVIIGHDTLGDREGMNDVLILADPYDTYVVRRPSVSRQRKEASVADCSSAGL